MEIARASGGRVDADSPCIRGVAQGGGLLRGGPSGDACMHAHAYMERTRTWRSGALLKAAVRCEVGRQAMHACMHMRIWRGHVHGDQGRCSRRRAVARWAVRRCAMRAAWRRCSGCSRPIQRRMPSRRRWGDSYADCRVAAARTTLQTRRYYPRKRERRTNPSLPSETLG